MCVCIDILCTLYIYIYIHKCTFQWSLFSIAELARALTNQGWTLQLNASAVTLVARARFMACGLCDHRHSGIDVEHVRLLVS